MNSYNHRKSQRWPAWRPHFWGYSGCVRILVDKAKNGGVRTPWTSMDWRPCIGQQISTRIWD